MLPLSLYIHMPWCIRKCPYCDFNSHKSPDTLPEDDYINTLIKDLQDDLSRFPAREVSSIFIGGGTPSLFTAKAFDRLFNQIQNLLPFTPSIEITLEANPGTFEQQRFIDYRKAGINRLSLGIQSLNAKHLKALGRIHDDKQAHAAIAAARLSGFDNINLDIMHGLPKQSIEEGLEDLRQALSHSPEHLSWYQLTIEPNTLFYKKTPVLPSEDEAFILEEQGFDLLKKSKFNRYEISAFTQANQASQHNLNYWQFGDYLGIGAGAHGKYTTTEGVFRTRKHRQPHDYLNPDKACLSSIEQVDAQTLLFEFMLNTTRLEQAIPHDLFLHRTGQDVQLLKDKLIPAQNKGFITISDSHWQITPLGRRFTNDLQALFLPE